MGGADKWSHVASVPSLFKQQKKNRNGKKILRSKEQRN